jgi:hypothetical protein
LFARLRAQTGIWAPAGAEDWRRHDILLGALLLAFLAIAPAVAQTSKDAPGRLTPTGATSACLGQPTTPICAAETLLACLARSEARLCRAIGLAPPAPVPDGVPQIEYVIERVSVIRPADVTDDLKDLEWYKPGYTLIELLRRSCPATQADCGDESWDGVQVYLRNRGGGAAPHWEVVHWRSDAEQDVAPQEPENFQEPKPPAR